MTNKVTMPDPIGHISVTTGGVTVSYLTNKGARSVRSGDTLITTWQAEAYANAMVKQALEGLAKIAKDRYDIALSSRYNCDDGECPDTWEATAVAMAYSYQTMETHIRALIPKEPPCET